MVNVEGNGNAVRRSGQLRLLQHRLRDFEGVEIRVAVAGAEHGQVRDARGGSDVAVGILVPLGGIEVLGQEDRVVNPDLAYRRSAEIADKEHRLGDGDGGDDLRDDDIYTEGFRGTVCNREVFA